MQRSGSGPGETEFWRGRGATERVAMGTESVCFSEVDVDDFIGKPQVRPHMTHKHSHGVGGTVAPCAVSHSFLSAGVLLVCVCVCQSGRGKRPMEIFELVAEDRKLKSTRQTDAHTAAGP